MDAIKLVCFDLDETLITHNSWLVLGAKLGVTPQQDAALAAQYRAGSLTYDEWNEKYLELCIKHTDATRTGITNILSEYTLSPGAREAVEYVKNKGYHLVLISGAIDILVSCVAQDLGIKHYKANNTLVFDEQDRWVGIHSGGTDTHAKLRYLESFAEMLGVAVEECATIGDGANDIELFLKSGHGITFKGSPIEREAWKVIETFEDLRHIL